MPIIQAPLQPPASARLSPLANPNAFGNELGAVADVLDVVAQEAQQRNEQRQTAELATLRATLSTQAADFLQGLEQETDFTQFPGAWDAERARMEGIIAQADPAVQEAFAPDAIRLFGTTSRGVSALAHSREADHIAATMDQANADLMALASSPTADHEGTLAMGEQNIMEVYRSGGMSELQATNAIQAWRREYLINMNMGAIQQIGALEWLSQGGALPSGSEMGLVPQGARDHLTGANLDGVDDSGFVVPASMRPVLNETLDRANAAAAAAGVTLDISDTWRSSEDNETSGGADESQHLDGMAVDIRGFAGMPSDQQIRLVQSLVDAGFTSFGFYPSGGMHVDRRPGEYATWGSDYTSATAERDAPPGVLAAIAERLANPQSSFSEGGAYVGEQTGPRPLSASDLAFRQPPLDGLSPTDSVSIYEFAYRQAERELATMQADIATQVEDYNTALQLGLEGQPRPSRDAIDYAWQFAPNDGAELNRQLDLADSLAVTYADMREMSNTDLRAFVEEQREQLVVPGAGLTERAETFAAIAGAAETILAARNDDIAAYTLSQHEDIAELFQGAQTAGDWQVATDRMVEAQLAYVDHPSEIRPLPAAVVASMMEAYTQEESPQARVEMLLGLTSNDSGALIFDQLEAADLDPGMRRVIAAADRIGLPMAADTASLLANFDEWEQRFREEVGGNAEYETAVTALLEQFRPRNNMYDGRAAVTGDIGQTADAWRDDQDAFIRVAVALAARMPGPSLGNRDAAATEAMERLYGGAAYLPDDIGYAEVPVDSMDAIATGMDVVRESLLAMDPTTEFSIPPRIAESAWEGVVQGARWVNEGEDGYALALAVSDPERAGALLMGSDGSVRVWTADDLIGAGARQTRIDEMTDALVTRGTYGPILDALGIGESIVPTPLTDDQRAEARRMADYAITLIGEGEGPETIRPAIEYFNSRRVDSDDAERAAIIREALRLFQADRPR